MGYKLDSIAIILQEMGFPLNKGHLMRGLGKIEKENSKQKIVPMVEHQTEILNAEVLALSGEGRDQFCVEIDGEKYDLRLDMPDELNENVRKKILWLKAQASFQKKGI